MTKTTKIIIGVVVVLIIIAGLWWLSIKQMGGETIKIGVITPLTGEAAIYGESAKKGLDLAAEEINNKGGILGKKVELIYEDTHLDSDVAVAAVNKFINVDKISFIIAAEGSGATLVVTPLADKNKTVMVVPIASAAAIRDAGDYVFRTMPSDGYRGTEMSKLAVSKGYNKIAILYVNDAYGVGIKNSLKETFTGNGKQITNEESFDSGATDFRTQLTKIKASNPDAIMVEARKEFPVLLKQIKELDIKSQIIASEMLDKSLLPEIEVAGEGLLAIDFAPTTDYANFKVEYKNKYETDPAIYSDNSYDSLRVLAVAIQNAGTTNSAKVKDTLYNAVYNGATGVVKFDSYGEVTEKSFIIYQLKDGQFVPYGN